MSAFKRQIESITGCNVSLCSDVFRHDPSSDNWMLLDRAMKAHQVATTTREDTLDIILALVPQENTINELAKHYDDIAEIVEKACLDGRVRLIKSAA
jgi:hypothetical protein